jgi:DNA-binding MarR family transcriptional regulator
MPQSHHSISLSQVLYTSSRLLIQQIQTVLKEFGLTYPQFLVMQILWEEDGLKVHELGTRLALNSGTLTPLLKKLQSQNFLKRKRGGEDERTVRIHLTYPGKSLQSKVSAAIDRWEESLPLEVNEATSKLLPLSEDYLQKIKPIK